VGRQRNRDIPDSQFFGLNASDASYAFFEIVRIDAVFDGFDVPTPSSLALSSGPIADTISSMADHEPGCPHAPRYATGAEVRAACRTGQLDGPTAGYAPGFTQANLVVVPERYAAVFQQFCRRNPKPCPLLEVTAPGLVTPERFAPGSDLRTDVPRYRVWRQGRLVDEPRDVLSLWQPDFVSFLIGCSFTFEAALIAAGIPIRHLQQGRNVPMFRTNRPCTPAGVFSGPLVVSMRPMTPPQAVAAERVTARFPGVHGAPIQVGDAESLGIGDLFRPDFGDPVEIRPGEVPVFWACGVTPQCALMAAGLPLAITHAPGCMLVTDVRDETLAVD
jgi:uncharacterized protein YcsI (UPF0317 family)